MALDILVVDDELDIRELVAGVLSDEGYECRTAGDSTTALAMIDQRRPSVVLLDVWLHGSPMDGLEVLDAIKVREPELPVIIFSGHGNIDTAVAAVGRGAMDFIEKPFNDQVLLDCVHNALAEDAVRRRARARRRIIQRRFETLTPREQEVLKQVAEGLSNRQIADSLNLSRKTVEVHRAKVMQKMEAETLSQLIRMAMLMGVLKTYDD